MTIAYVYVIAFKDKRFLMVRHARRMWEMPGGKVEGGESPEAAAYREFIEETGYEVTGLRVLEKEEDGIVYVGDVGDKISAPRVKEVSDVAFFEELPGDLSFPLVEYKRMIDAATKSRQ